MTKAGRWGSGNAYDSSSETAPRCSTAEDGRKMLNEALRLVRVYHDLSQADVAERVGLSKSYVSEIESGEKNVSIAVLEKYSTAFDIP
jgi:DNA-binding XRE family transcriptional regulator